MRSALERSELCVQDIFGVCARSHPGTAESVGPLPLWVTARRIGRSDARKLLALTSSPHPRHNYAPRSPHYGDIRPAMNRPSPKLTSALLCLACLLLSACAGRTAGEHIADMPHWMGGEPEGVPPRPGTPEYDAWMAARTKEAARPKTDQPKTETDRSKTGQPNTYQLK